MKIKILTFILCIVSFSCFSQSSETKNKFFKATFNNITIDVPEGFEALTNQNGFLHKGSASTLMVSEITNSPFSFTESHFKSDNLEKDGAKLAEKTEIKTTSGQNAVLYTLNFTVKSKDNSSSIDFERLILVTGNETTTVVVVANYPVMIRKLIQEPLKASLLSVFIN